MSGAITPVASSSSANARWQPNAQQEARLDHHLDAVEHALDGVVKNSSKAAKIPEHETRAQQQARETAEHTVTRKEQQIREAKEHEVAAQAQKEREAREHGLPPPPPSPPASGTAAGSERQVPAPPHVQAKAARPKIAKTQARLFSANSTSKPPVTGTQSAAQVGEGTHPLHPVPQNGGERSEAPTTVADINAIINDIDPSLLTDPSQKGEGRLTGLPYGKMFEAAGAATGIDPAILYADSQVETGDNKHGRILEPNNINPIQTAPGVWPTTDNAATNLFTGAYVMKDYIDRAGGDLKRGLNAYNTGNLAPGETGFADGYAGYYEGVMAAFGNVEKAIRDPSIIEPGQGGNVSIASQI